MDGPDPDGIGAAMTYATVPTRPKLRRPLTGSMLS
jgi:hypothetical protein